MNIWEILKDVVCAGGGWDGYPRQKVELTFQVDFFHSGRFNILMSNNSTQVFSGVFFSNSPTLHVLSLKVDGEVISCHTFPLRLRHT